MSERNKYLNMNSKYKDDSHYRYKMDAVKLKYEGFDKSQKTVIENGNLISKQIGCPFFEILLKFISLHSSIPYYADKDVYYLKGKHSADCIQKYILKFINDYVLCQQCDNPETVFSTNRNLCTVYTTCAACNYKRKLDSDQFTKFIFKKLEYRCEGKLKVSKKLEKRQQMLKRREERKEKRFNDRKMMEGKTDSE